MCLIISKLPPPHPQLLDHQSVRLGFWVGLIILVVACIAAYYPILFNDFLYYWDDQWQVINRYTEGGINFGNIWSIFTEYFGGQYSPVNQSMYLFIYSLFGYNPMAFHAASLLLHIGCVCLAYIIIIRIFRQTTLITFHNAHAVAFITAMLFAVHPMNVESVAWISASKIVVYAFFYLLSTYTYIIYLDRKRIVFYILTLLLFALSFGGKEQAVTFPIWLLMLYWILGHSLKDRKVWKQVAPFFVLAIVFGIVTMLSQASNGGGLLSNASTYPLWQRFILGCYSIIEYIVKFTIPYNLLYIYAFPMVKGEPLPTWMLLYPGIILVACISLWDWIRRLPLNVGLGFFLIHIALVLHIVPISRFVVIADRYIYLACIGFSFILAFYFIRFLAAKNGNARRIAIGCMVCIMLFFTIYSNIRTRDWKDVDSIKKEIRELLKKRDDYVAPELEKLLDNDNSENGEKEEGEAEEEGKSGEKPEAPETSENINKRETTRIVSLKSLLIYKYFYYEQEVFFSIGYRSNSSWIHF